MPQASEELNLSTASNAEGPYSFLLKSIRLEDTITAKESDPPPDPEAGRDANQEFMLRYSG